MDIGTWNYTYVENQKSRRSKLGHLEINLHQSEVPQNHNWFTLNINTAQDNQIPVDFCFKSSSLPPPTLPPLLKFRSTVDHLCCQ